MSTRLLLRLLRYAHYFLSSALIIITAAILVSNYVITVFRVDGHSMDPTLHDTQLLPVCLACFTNSSPQLNQIVIVEYEGTTSITFVKRIVGIPGSTVPYQGSEITLDDTQYFVVGDNRDHSTDSRAYGPIKRSQIKGLVLGSFADGPGAIVQ